jgi:hypothetical protein
MAHALNYPHLARDVAPATGATRPGLFTRILRRMQAAQMARARRELRLYAPHLEAQLEMGEYRTLGLSNDERLPFVR